MSERIDEKIKDMEREDTPTVTGAEQALLIKFQRNEITGYRVYSRLAELEKGKNSEVFERIAKDELGHYKLLQKLTGVEVTPSSFEIFMYILLFRIFGATFTIRLLERTERGCVYDEEELRGVPGGEYIVEDTKRHMGELADLIEEDKLKYISSIMLGMSDAIVELTGVLAGLTFALQDTRLVGLAGLITGIAATLSMSSSEYLSQKEEGDDNGGKPLKAALYTGLAYIFVVALLITPYLMELTPFVALGFMLFDALIVISIFSYYISVVKDMSFKRKFLEISAISFGVAGVSFVIGALLRGYLGVDI